MHLVEFVIFANVEKSLRFYCQLVMVLLLNEKITSEYCRALFATFKSCVAIRVLYSLFYYSACFTEINSKIISFISREKVTNLFFS